VILWFWEKIPQLKLKTREKIKLGDKKTMSSDNEQIKSEMDDVINELEKKGVSFNTRDEEFVGLGDVVESTLNTFGITQERFKAWFNLKECNCNKRKKWLNNLFSWKKK
tara:strand:+ start:1279 stop:1605 length:327 start_codon:yes stop_codon:yes gene_type:complete